MENQIFELISKMYAKINNLWLNQRLLFCKKNNKITLGGYFVLVDFVGREKGSLCYL